jgi:hypothetical protein
MKKLLVFLFLIQSFVGFSQTIKKKLSDKKIFNLICENTMKVDLTNSDTSYYIFCAFQNMNYSQIIDLGSVYINSRYSLDKTINELKECLKYMDEKSISYSIGSFQIYDFSNNLYINDKSKYTTLTKKHVLTWIEWLESCIVK